MIAEKSVQEILDTAKVEDVVQEFVNLKRRGSNLIGLCPFHSEKTPSFAVSPSKNIYKCFGCGRGGNAVNFLMEHEQMSFPEALRYLAKKYGIELEETGDTDEAREQRQYQESLYLLNQFARDFYQNQLFDTDRGKSVALHYFKERGFREETIKKFGLGYAPNRKNAFTQKAVSLGYDIELLRKLGLTGKYDRDFFRDRVMFTIHNLSGKVIGFGGRILNKDIKAPKYINTPETEVYNKSRVLYGAYFAKQSIRREDECILVEGYTDVLSLHQAGIENVVASSGTSLTKEQIGLIKRYSDNIKILYDGDYAGTKAALRGLDMVLAQGLNVSVVMLPEGEDPDSYLQAVGTKAFKAYIDREARDFILFKANLLLKDASGDPVKKTNAIKDIVGSIARIPDPLKRSLFIKECARVVDVDEQLLVSETNKVVAQELRKQQRKQQRQDRQESAGIPEPAAPVESAGAETAESPPAKSPKSTGDEFQEKDIVRILITGGDKIFDIEEKITVAQFILGNLEDVFEEFDNKLYQRIVQECRELLAEGRSVNFAHFSNHPEENIQQLAVNLNTTPVEYSHNWEKKWDIILQMQKMPDENFYKDALYSVRRFRQRKIERMLRENRQKIKEAAERGNEEEIDNRMKAHQRLQQVRNELAAELGTVIY